ncbi:MAG: hypothetical protein ABLT11_11835 [Candidatus Acidiferrum sp.]
MRQGTRFRIIPIVLLALLAVPFAGLAQEQAQEHAKKHKRYTLVDLGTFGGPNSNINGGSAVINDKGTIVGGADTADWDPICGCPVFHAFKWHDGVSTDLGTLPGGANFSYAITLNSHGVIGGISANGLIDPTTGIESFVATKWKNNGEVVDLGTFGGSFSLAVSMNDRGQIVGGAEDAIPDPFNFGGIGGLPSPTQWHATLWQDGSMRDLGTLGGPDAFAAYLNECGQIAGNSFTNSIPNPSTGIPTVDPFLWENGQMVDIGSLGGTFGLVTGVNNRGQVTGFSYLAGDQAEHAFLWERGSLLDLGTLGGDYSDGYWIDDSGEVVGGATTPDNLQLRAVRWKNGHVTNLGSLDDDVCSFAASSNSKGQIVGSSIPCDIDGPSRAFLWENGGPMVDLQTLVPPGASLVLAEAEFINDRGEIAGAAQLPNGDSHAVLLIPRDRDDDAADDATAVVQNDVTPVTTSSVTVPHTGLTPEKLAQMRARFAKGHRGFGIRLPR